MSSTLAYKCDECGKTASYEDSRCFVEIEIKLRSGYGAEIRRDLCSNCWQKRKENVINAIAGAL